MLKLIGSDGTRIYSWLLRPGEYILGRGSDADFVVPDKTISRRHVLVEVPPNGQICYVTDQNSHNGTFVNGKKVETRVAVGDGDRVVFGQVEFKLLPETAGAPVGSRPFVTQLADIDPEKSVFLSLNEALKPLPPKVTDLPDVLPTMFEMAKILVLPEPQQTMLETALRLVGKVIPAERLAVLTTSDDGSDIVTQACLLPGGKDPGSFNLSRTVIDEILTLRNSILIDPHDDPKFSSQESIVASNIRSAMAAPLFDGGDVRGILYVDTTNPVHRYNDDYLRLLASFGNLIASRLLNYELMKERQEREVFAAELRRASLIQQNLLTKSLPEIPGFAIHAFQEQCRAVGGDLYDVAVLPDGCMVFVVADVSGKGMGGALLMSNILAAFRILYRGDQFSLHRVVKLVSQQLLKYSAAEDFATVFAGMVNPNTNTLSYVNAGHNPPILVRNDGTVEYLEPSGTMIGAFDFSDWTEQSTVMQPGDSLLVFTDGITEADKGEELYGDERLVQLVTENRNLSPCDLVESVMKDVTIYVDGSPRSDDITMLALKRE